MHDEQDLLQETSDLLFGDILNELPAEEVKVEQEPEEEIDPMERERLSAINAILQYENSPTQQEIESWIDRYGSDGVLVVKLSGTDLFVLRYISAGEYSHILAELTKARQRVRPEDVESLMKIEDRMKFLMVKCCCLWYPGEPAPISEDYFTQGRAGLLTQLSQVVRAASYFFDDPNQVLQFTTPLK